MHNPNEISEPEQVSYKKQIPVLASFYFLYYCTLGIVFPFSGYFFKERGFTGTEIGFYLAIVPVVSFLSTAFWAKRFSATNHKKLFISLGMFLSTISLLTLYFTENRVITAFVMASFSFFKAGILPVVDSAAVALGDKISYGRLRLFGSVGFILTSVTAGFFLDRYGLGSFILTFTVSGILSIIPALFMKFDHPLFSRKSPSELKLTPELRVFFIGLTVYLATFAFLSNFFNIKVASVGLTQTQAGYMWSVGVISEIFFFYNQEKVLKFISIKPLIIISILLGGVRYLVTGYAESFTVLLIFSSFHGFSYGTFHIGVMQYIRHKVPENLKLKAQAIYSGVGYGLGTIIGSGVSGVIYDHVGIRAVFITAFFFCITGAFVIYSFIASEDKNGGE